MNYWLEKNNKKESETKESKHKKIIIYRKQKYSCFKSVKNLVKKPI